MSILRQSRTEQIKSGLLPQSFDRRGEMELFKSESMIEEINLGKIFEDAQPRLHSTHTSTFRQAHQLSFIKDRFKRMIELQNRNFVERNQLQKEREAILKQQETKARSRANRVKDERSHNGEALRSWRVRNMHEGALVRERRLHNQWIRSKRDIDELKDKQSMVGDRHRSMLATHGRATEGRSDQSFRKRLKVNQQYHCGLILKMSSLISPKRSRSLLHNTGKELEGFQDDRYKWKQVCLS